MTDKQAKAYGTWPSLITPETITADNTTFDDVIVDPTISHMYYIERRPNEDGRSVIVDAHSAKDVIPSGFNARNGVHEYGGAAAVAYDNVVYFSNYSDSRVYTVNTVPTGSTPVAVTPDDSRYRYANFAVHPTSTNLVAAVLEYHPDPQNDDPEKVENGLCVINTTTKTQPSPLRPNSTTVFYAAPVFNPSGTKMAWQEWKEPWMPFEAGFIYVADVQIVDDGMTLSNVIQVAGSETPTPVSVNYPLWLSDTALLYASDEPHFANPYIYSTETGKSTAVLPSPIEQDFCEPQWFFGLYPYAPIGDGTYGVFTAFKDGRNILYVLNLKTPSKPVLVSEFPFAVAEHVRHLSGNTFVFTGATSKQLPGVVRFTLNKTCCGWNAEWEYIKQASLPTGLEDYLSTPEAKQIPDPDDATQKIQAVLYLPNNPKYEGLPDEKPPCITHVHGGPTSMEAQGLSLVKMYYTSRGFAWLDVNYRGSSGYGREYIDKLAGNWGILDNKDCRSVVSYLNSQNLIDSQRASVRGGSAGGYTTLCSVTAVSGAPRFYKAATSAYGGISHLLDLAKKTEKFELRYMWRLLGGPPSEIEQVYKDRSPFFRVDSTMGTPLLMLQGEQDFVVPKEQATDLEKEVHSLAPHEILALIMYPGEGHGFRKAENIRGVLRREHQWYLEYLL